MDLILRWQGTPAQKYMSKVVAQLLQESGGANRSRAELAASCWPHDVVANGRVIAQCDMGSLYVGCAVSSWELPCRISSICQALCSGLIEKVLFFCCLQLNQLHHSFLWYGFCLLSLGTCPSSGLQAVTKP